MPKGVSLDAVFDGKTAYRLWSPEKKGLSLYTKMYTSMSDGPDQDPIHGVHNKSHVYCARIETLQSNQSRKPMEPSQVAVKWVRGQLGVDKLRYEAALYKDELRPLQGDAVPRFYGFFCAEIEGIIVGCLVLEWCKTVISLEKLELRRMGAVSRLHQVGVVHGNLRETHHFMFGLDGKVRIVDFSAAKLHRCLYGFRTLAADNNIGCEELYAMESRLGVYVGGFAQDKYMLNGATQSSLAEELLED